MVYQLLIVKRKENFNLQDRKLYSEIKSVLNVPSLKKLQSAVLYEVSGLSESELQSAAPGLLFENPSDSYSFSGNLSPGFNSSIFIKKFGYTDNSENNAESDKEFSPDFFMFAREYLPGQFDQRADSALRGLSLIFPEKDIDISRSDIFYLHGSLSKDEISRIKKWLINPVDSREKNPDKPSLGNKAEEPEPVPVIDGFRKMTAESLHNLKTGRGIALSIEDLEFIQDWFNKKEKRDPTLAELKVLDTYWSDHCRHTTFETELSDIEVLDLPEADDIKDALDQWETAREYCGRTEKPKTLMDLATIGAREAYKKGQLEDWDVSEEINACTIKVDAEINGKSEKWLLSFKNETHNHPTEIEPYGGASTCLGGAVRDPLSGRAYVHQALRVTGGADPREKPSDTRKGKLPQRLIARGAAEGYSGYGNQLGLATSVVNEHYHCGYAAKRLECGAVMGASPAANVIRETPAEGDIVVLAGGRTGRDGIGGATGSSVAHDGQSLEKAGAEVQKGNPPEERKLQRLFRNPEASTLIIRSNDFGAGGVSVAVGELSDSLDIYLDNVPVKYSGLNGLELALSESQERMAVVLHPADADRFLELAEKENLEAVKIAEIKNTGRLRMFWKNDCVVNLSRALLDTNGIRRKAEAVISVSDQDVQLSENISDRVVDSVNAAAELKEKLSSLQLASRLGLEERFDGSVGGTTVLSPRGGLRQLTPAEASVHLIPADGDVKTAGIMSVGFNPYLTSISPFRGAQYAMIEALAKITAAGGSWRRARFSLQEFFGRTDRGPQAWGRPLSALLGALTIQRRWNLPAIGGKDSMSGSFEDLDVPPTLIAFAACAMDSSKAVSAALPLKTDPEKIYESSSNTVSDPGSDSEPAGIRADQEETIALISCCSGAHNEYPERPDFVKIEKGFDFAEKLNSMKKIISAASVGSGGWLSKLTLMTFGNNTGVELTTLDNAFAEDYGALIIAVKMSAKELESAALQAGADCRILGKVIDKPELVFPPSAGVSDSDGENTGTGKFHITVQEALDSWLLAFSEIWPVDNTPSCPVPSASVSGKSDRSSGSADAVENSVVSAFNIVNASPRVLIPVFPGTNGEDDARRAFSRAGALPAEHVFNDHNTKYFNNALKNLAFEIKKSQILYISGGFSAGDEPDGAGKYVAAILRHPEVAESISYMLERGGLILGICNGFQALLKSGWLYHGRPAVPGPEDPTLAHNRIGRHVARIVRTVSAGAESPWLSRIKAGDVYSVPVSHGEGRFTAPEHVIDKLVNDGRVAFQYCNYSGIPDMGGEFNPNGSDLAIEGIISPCGRILGKMGHSERWRRGTFMDVPGMETEQPLIKGGVEWFK